MVTEREIIYTILNTVRSGEFNTDEPLTEKLLRNYLKTHRASRLIKYYEKGRQVPDECFQLFKDIEFNSIGNLWTCNTVPNVIPFPKYEGVFFLKNDYPISVVTAKKWKNNQKDRWNKLQPTVKLFNNQAFLYTGALNTNTNVNDDLSSSELNAVVNALSIEATQGKIKLDGRFVLQNPSDDPNYDWTKNKYPFPSEQIDMLVNSVTARELNVFLRVSSDEVGNKFSNENPNPQTEEL
jgi:hypothetical protein